MIIKRFFCTILLSVMLIGATHSVAWAVEDSYYDVRGLQVRAKDRNELAAKRSALNFGKQQAFNEMISRFLTKRDFERLQQPKLPAIENMIRDLQLEEERYGSGIYIATLNIRFRLENVREYLQKIGFAYSETVARPYLLLPVFIDLRSQKVWLWEPENLWLDSWLDRGDINDKNLLPIYLPHSNLQDNFLLSNVSKINQDRKILNRIKDYYHTHNVILMTASTEYQPSNRSLKGVEVVAHFLTNDWQRDSIVVNLADNGDAVKILNKARKVIFAEIQDQWKQNTAIELGKENTLRVNVKIASLKEWQKIKTTLQAVPDVIDFRLVQLGKGEAVIEMVFYGDPQRLGRALAREFLTLSEQKKEWFLQTSVQQVNAEVKNN